MEISIRKRKGALAALMFLIPGITSVHTEKPASLPDFSYLKLYSSDSPFNQSIDENAKIDPNSSRYIKALKKSAPLLINLKQYTAPVYIVGSSTARHDVKLPCGKFWEIGVNRLLDVPVPAWAEPHCH